MQTQEGRQGQQAELNTQEVRERYLMRCCFSEHSYCLAQSGRLQRWGRTEFGCPILTHTGRLSLSDTQTLMSQQKGTTHPEQVVRISRALHCRLADATARQASIEIWPIEIWGDLVTSVGHRLYVPPVCSLQGLDHCSASSAMRASYGSRLGHLSSPALALHRSSPCLSHYSVKA